MSICRTCLKTPANKDISGLENDINEDNRNYLDIMLFCLDIKVNITKTINFKLSYNLFMINVHFRLVTIQM